MTVTLTGDWSWPSGVSSSGISAMTRSATALRDPLRLPRVGVAHGDVDQDRVQRGLCAHLVGKLGLVEAELLGATASVMAGASATSA